MVLLAGKLAGTIENVVPPLAGAVRPRRGALVRAGRLGRDGWLRTSRHCIRFRRSLLVGAAAAAGGGVLHGGDDRLGAQPSAGRGVAWKGRAYQERRVSTALETVEAWSGKDRGDENFPVGSLLIAPRLRPHVHAFYAFARNADDIADRRDARGRGEGRAARRDGGRAARPARRRLAERAAAARQPGRDRRDAAAFARPADRVPPRCDQAALCELGRAATTTAAIRRCRSDAMCSICMARTARHMRRRMRCARRCRC